MLAADGLCILKQIILLSQPKPVCTSVQSDHSQKMDKTPKHPTVEKQQQHIESKIKMFTNKE